jgi:small GTP-binding protein
MSYLKSSSAPSLPVSLQLIGASAVGKSCIYKRSTDPEWKFQYEVPVTIGVAKPAMKTYRIDGDDFRVNIWDCGGQERFEVISRAFLKNADGCVLIYAVDDAKSFDCVSGWIEAVEDIKKNRSSKGRFQVVLVANKTDLAQARGFKNWKEKGDALAKEYGCPFFLTSAKTNKGIETMFEHAAKLMKRDFDKYNSEKDQDEKNRIHEKDDEEVKESSNTNSCCVIS